MSAATIPQAMALTAIAKATPDEAANIDAVLSVAYAAEWAAMGAAAASPAELAYKMKVFAGWIGDLKAEDFGGLDGFAEAATGIAFDLLRIVARAPTN